MADLVDTNFTKTVHRNAYPAISPTRPELSQAGRTVLITGGATGVGNSIARGFVLAKADTVILVSRRAEVLEKAVTELRKLAKDVQSSTKAVSFTCDVSKLDDIKDLWQKLATAGTTIDVLVLSAVRYTKPGSLFELGIKDVWTTFETNFMLNVTTQGIHMLEHPLALMQSLYTLSKGSAVFALQITANTIPHEEIQIISFHPGVIFSEDMVKNGMTRESLPYDEDDLPGAFAVWAASKEAAFLHGRFAWAAWDVDELSTGDIRRCIDSDPDYLRIKVGGLHGAFRAD